MTKRTPSSVFLPCALMLALVSGCLQFRRPLHEKTVTITVPHVPDSPLQADSHNGSLSVTAADREDVEVTAHLRMTTLERLEAAEITAARDADGRLVVAVVWPDGERKGNEGCSFVIALQNAAGVTLRTTNGRIKTAGLSGEANLHTKNGGIDVEAHQGDVIARTRNGAISVIESAGDLDLASSNGRVKVVEAAGAVKVETSNGSVHVNHAEAGRGPVDVQTSNGSVTLEIGTGFRGELTADNSNGRIRMSLPSDAELLSSGKHHAQVRFGNSGGTSHLRTSNGSIEIRSR